ncbi:MAG: dethiobiotin synthase [[Eubacterium] saphenum]|nr:dethiobiotin synthase [[Eubacterium] saphenum]
MAKGLFVTATGTDIGKTYVTALIVKKLRSFGLNAGYYKAAVSGAESVSESDAGYVNRIAEIGESEELLLSYLYKTAVSPHLAARIEGNPAEMSVIKSTFEKVCGQYDFVTMEGSGGIVCPIRKDEKAVIYLEDIIAALGLPSIIVADAGLGTINAVVTTVEYMRKRKLPINGIILNKWNGDFMQRDNLAMIEELTGVRVVAVVKDGDTELEIDEKTLVELYKDLG